MYVFSPSFSYTSRSPVSFAEGLWYNEEKARNGEARGMEPPKRKQNRLSAYDYSAPGAYFVTVCTADRRRILSGIRRGDPCGRPSPILTGYGEIVEQCLKQAENLYAVRFESYVIMPNHIHFICVINQPRATARVAPTLGHVVGALKSLSANRCRENGLKGKLWQRGYYEHVIRNEKDYQEIWNYIDTNPARWAEDRYYADGEQTAFSRPHGSRA